MFFLEKQRPWFFCVGEQTEDMVVGAISDAFRQTPTANFLWLTVISLYRLVLLIGECRQGCMVRVFPRQKQHHIAGRRLRKCVVNNKEG